jgi:hypothetical protein
MWIKRYLWMDAGTVLCLIAETSNKYALPLAERNDGLTVFASRGSDGAGRMCFVLVRERRERTRTKQIYSLKK